MRKKYMMICLILGFLCLIYGLIVAIAGSGGTKFFVVWIGIAVIFFAFAGVLHMGLWEKIPQAVKWIAGIVCGIFLISFVVIEGLIISQMKAQGEPKLDYIIVLGAQVHADKPSVVLKYRLDEAILYLNENPETICIVSGGQGKNEPYSEAYGMEKYLTENGIDKERILLEDKSKTTEENLSNSRKYIPEDATVGIITNDFHMFRALQIAEKQGLSNVCGIAVDSTRFYLPNNMFREYLAEIKFLLKCKLQ